MGYNVIAKKRRDANKDSIQTRNMNLFNDTVHIINTGCFWYKDLCTPYVIANLYKS